MSIARRKAKTKKKKKFHLFSPLLAGRIRFTIPATHSLWRFDSSKSLKGSESLLQYPELVE